MYFWIFAILNSDTCECEFLYRILEKESLKILENPFALLSISKSRPSSISRFGSDRKIRVYWRFGRRSYGSSTIQESEYGTLKILENEEGLLTILEKVAGKSLRILEKLAWLEFNPRNILEKEDGFDRRILENDEALNALSYALSSLLSERKILEKLLRFPISSLFSSPWSKVSKVSKSFFVTAAVNTAWLARNKTKKKQAMLLTPVMLFIVLCVVWTMPRGCQEVKCGP